MTLRSASSILSAQDYNPFGEEIRSYLAGGTDDKYKFTGKERDKESGLDYFGARYYDSEIGRWLSVDPLASKYPSWSPYNYCMNNPLGLVDPDGRDPVFVGPNKAIAEERWNVTVKEICKTQLGRYLIGRLYNQISGEKHIPDFNVSFSNMKEVPSQNGEPRKPLGAMRIPNQPYFKSISKAADYNWTVQDFNVEININISGLPLLLTICHEGKHIIDYVDYPKLFQMFEYLYSYDYENDPNEIAARDVEKKVQEELDNKADNSSNSDFPDLEKEHDQKSTPLKF